ncbi:hypothetical protein GFY24_05960 [Nocardia sp. SYP-A9097]|uniref:SPW repeat protein n=1 Tax=Nocardia sp. SYP-A9097 TaxID=2663237 RepID=UPI00129B498C|nr:SPW repeat protein [Nocardia sp. SYP-A9097]MRH87015.1 hypothetical protein [Nocardia sp. SYP-A9097]
MFTESRTHAVTVILGAIAALSPLWVVHSDKAMWSLVVLGVLIAFTGLGLTANLVDGIADYALAVLGALLFLSPWVMGFDSYNGASWTAWVVGALSVVMALSAMPAVTGRLHLGASH